MTPEELGGFTKDLRRKKHQLDPVFQIVKLRFGEPVTSGLGTVEADLTDLTADLRW